MALAADAFVPALAGLAALCVTATGLSIGTRSPRTPRVSR